MKNVLIGIIACILFLLVGFAVGYIVSADEPVQFIRSGITPAQASVSAAEQDNSQSTANKQLLDQAFLVADLIKRRDFYTLSEYIHPEKGVVFAPYSTIDLSVQQQFTPGQIRKTESDASIYVWGMYDGEGSPIELTLSDYFDEFVYNADYSSAPVIGVDSIVKTGNSLENIKDAFPDGRFVELHFPGIDPSNEGFDWCSLKIVFEEFEGRLLVVALIHSQWTV